MSYQVLARKWRPGNFAEMVGQEHVLQALINALDNNRLHHAYLFTGTRGVGKTTIARILAKALNCDQGVSSVPCGECGPCTEIAEGRFVDLIEVDAASRTKVEDTRELLENVQYAPTSGRYKVYLIDEVHMLSNHSFNALLKTLEEPPPHIKFLLATTDPQKLPVTILSRCLQFNLKNLSAERIVHHLQHILDQEKVPFEENGLWSLARAADGSMRDALSLTDQAIAHGGGQIRESEVNGMLGTIDLSVVLDLCNTVAAADSAAMLELVESMSEHAPDYSEALAEILSIWHRVAIAQTVPDALDNRHGDHQAVMALADSLPREDVQLFYQIGLLGRRDINLAPDPRTGFEMALLRMIAFKPVGETSPRAAKIQPLNTEQEPSSGGDATPKKPEPAVGLAVQSAEKLDREVSNPAAPEVEEVERAAASGQIEEEKQQATVACDPLADKSEPLEAPVTDEPEQKFPLERLRPDSWIDFYRGLPIGGVIKNTAANLVLTERQGGHLKFQLDSEQSSLYEDAHQQRLADALTDYFEQQISVAIEIASVTAETPQANRARIQREKLAAAVVSMKQDPIVNQLIDTFDGALLEDTVKPVEEN